MTSLSTTIGLRAWDKMSEEQKDAEMLVLAMGWDREEVYKNVHAFRPYSDMGCAATVLKAIRKEHGITFHIKSVAGNRTNCDLFDRAGNIIGSARDLEPTRAITTAAYLALSK